MRHLFLYIIAALFWATPLAAQEGNDLRQIYAQAESDYNIGRFDQAQQLLKEHLSGFSGNLKQNVYRLLALCNLAQDDLATSEKYARQLLDENPSYTSVQDPVRFVDIINRLKSGRGITITTASNQAESIFEAPVPVTLITEDMIRISSARNLKEVLLAFVPGITNVECNEESNMAMHGIFSAGQEKILIMLNGHRLNSYCTNVARPDFAISLEKVKQIEVLRGPASSLYGGVALTAVVNIITKGGLDIDGLEVKGGLGNYGQTTASALFGKRYMDLDIFAWGKLYNADGEKVNIPVTEQLGTFPTPGDITIGGYNHRPTYDFGLTLKWKFLSLMHNTNFSKYVAPYTMSYFFAPYSYKDYRTFNGNLPGYANISHHTSLGYSQQFGKLGLSATIDYDSEIQTRYQVGADTLPEEFGYAIVPPGTDVRVIFTRGAFQYHHWQENNWSASIRGDYAYTLGNQHNGHINAGIHSSFFTLADSYYLEGDQFTRIVGTSDIGGRNLSRGNESAFDAYVQIKHKWKDLILNMGLRYDLKKRGDPEDFYKSDEAFNIHEWSPRLSVIYIRPKWNMKISYSKAFVDAPFFYRCNNLDTTMGLTDESEYLHAWQLSFATTQLGNDLNLECNLFYNKGENVVYPVGLFYTTSGKVRSYGAELTASYKPRRWQLYATATWMRFIEPDGILAKEEYESDLDRIIDTKIVGHHMYDVPGFTAALTAAYDATRNLSLHANAYFADKQIGHFESVDEDEYGINIYWNDLDIPSYVVCNLGFDYRIGRFAIAGNIHNLFNKTYSQGGTSIGPIRQQGRWALVSLSYKL